MFVKRLIYKSLELLGKSIKIVLLWALPFPRNFENTLDLLSKKSREQSAKFIEDNGSDAMLFTEREKLWAYAISLAKRNGIFAEFGVFNGKSMRSFVKKLPEDQIIYGFDSFQGLKEDFVGTGWTTGAFSTKGIVPKFPKNVILIKGWFQETLKDFLNQHNESFTFVHLDADTYQSTIDVLILIAPRFASGTVIIFDEFLGYFNWQLNEYRAWREICERYNFAYKFKAFSNQSVCIQIL